MEIKNPRRILALGAPDAGVLTLLKDLTGSAPDLIADTTAGLSHTWTLTTKYYTTTLPIWLDEIPSIAEWRSEFTKPEAREVITAIGAWIFCFRKPTKRSDVDAVKDSLSAIAAAIEKACGYSSDAVCLAVAMPQSMTPQLEMSGEEWEEVCGEFGFEYVDFEGRGRNEFGEESGVGRVREALEANEWEGEEGFGEMGDEGLDAEELEMNMELFGLKAAVQGRDEEEEDEAAQVEELESLMKRMVAVKEMGEGMPEAERKRFAARAVNDIMKDL